MIPLASGEISGLFWLVIVVIAGISKLVTKSMENAKPKVPQRTESVRRPVPSTGGDSEAERTRKFLEALGMPATALDPRQGSETMRSSRETVRGNPAATLNPPALPPQTMRGSRESMPHAPAPSRPAQHEIEAQRLAKKRRQAEQQRQAQRRVQPAETYDGAIERLHFAELQTPKVEEFHTKSSEVSAIPFEAAGSVVGQLYVKEGTARQNELIRLARSPKALRQAILLREILGPPRSLQSDFGTSNLAPL